MEPRRRTVRAQARPADEEVDEEAELEAGAGDDEEAEDGEPAEARADRYRNIPTWEEAISYLVKRSPKPGESSRGGRSRSSRGGSSRGGERRSN